MLRPIGAYLAEMVNVLPHDMTQFMLRIAIVDKFCAPLCQAISQQRSSQDLLEWIANRQLLMIPLDHEGRWYRYHTLLLEYFRQRMEAELLAEEMAPFTGARRIGILPRNYGLKRFSMRSQQATQSKLATGSRTARCRWSKRATC